MWRNNLLAKFSTPDSLKKLFFIVMLLLAGAASAVPVFRMPVVRIQPNGDTLHLFLTGDEYYHRLHDSADFTIVQHPQTGYWVYADIARQDAEHWDVIATDYRVGSVDPQSVGLQPSVGIDRTSWLKCQQRYQVPEWAAVPRPKASGRNHGTLNNIVIFIRFADDDDIEMPFDTIYAMFNDTSEASISMYSYFKTVSYNKIEIPTFFYPSPSGNLVVSYQDVLPRARFRPYNATTNPTGYTGGRATLEFDLLERAVNYINANYPVSDSLNLDADNDGNIDNICFIVKGANDGWNDLLWPHKWSLYDRNVYINGKRVYDFNFQLEGSGPHYFGSSTFCHEMFHTLGAPDLYHYDNYTYISPVGNWDLMGSNTTPPQNMGAYMKWKYGNWIDSIPEITEPGTYSLHSLGDATYDNCCYKIATEYPDQWYVLEYRDNTERFEQALPGSGLIIYRIDTRFEGDAGFDGYNYFDEVYVFRPGASSHNNMGYLSRAFFSADASRVEFTPQSDPFPWLTGNEVDSTLYITNIGVPGETISFTFNKVFICRVPKMLSAFDVTDAEASLSWSGNADMYLLQWRKEGSATVDQTFVTGSEYRLTGLERNTDYQWRVRSVCDEFDRSAFSDWATFRTYGCHSTAITELGVADTISNNIPIMPSMKYGYSQTIYLSSELNGAQDISRVALHYYFPTNMLTEKNDFVVYMGHTNKVGFEGTSNDAIVPPSSLRKVYEGSLEYRDYWMEIVLDSVFEYDGTSNLVLAILDSSGVSDQEPSYFYCTKTPDRKSCISFLDLQPIDIDDISGAIIKWLHNMYVDIRLISCEETVGIDERTEVPKPLVAVSHHTITVTDPLQRRVELYDIMGRRLQVAPGALQTSLSVPCAGVYLLRVDGLPARKVVVM